MSIGGGGGYGYDDDDDGGEDDDDDDDGDGDDERRYESGEAGRAQWQPRRTSHRDPFRRVTTARRTRDRASSRTTTPSVAGTSTKRDGHKEDQQDGQR